MSFYNSFIMCLVWAWVCYWYVVFIIIQTCVFHSFLSVCHRRMQHCCACTDSGTSYHVWTWDVNKQKTDSQWIPVERWCFAYWYHKWMPHIWWGNDHVHIPFHMWSENQKLFVYIMLFLSYRWTYLFIMWQDVPDVTNTELASMLYAPMATIGLIHCKEQRAWKSISGRVKIVYLL